MIDTFRVGGLLIAAFEYPVDTSSSWETVYAFPAYDKDGVCVRVILVEWHNLFGINGYFLEESFVDGHVTYETFDDKPDYKYLKTRVIDILGGR